MYSIAQLTWSQCSDNAMTKQKSHLKVELF